MRGLVTRLLLAVSLMLALVAGPLASAGCSKKSNDSAEKKELPPLQTFLAAQSIEHQAEKP